MGGSPRPLAPKFNLAHCPGDDFEGGDDEVKEGSEDEMMGDEFPHDSDEEVVDETKVVLTDYFWLISLFGSYECTIETLFVTFHSRFLNQLRISSVMLKVKLSVIITLILSVTLGSCC